MWGKPIKKTFFQYFKRLKKRSIFCLYRKYIYLIIYCYSYFVRSTTLFNFHQHSPCIGTDSSVCFQPNWRPSNRMWYHLALRLRTMSNRPTGTRRESVGNPHVAIRSTRWTIARCIAVRRQSWGRRRDFRNVPWFNGYIVASETGLFKVVKKNFV